VLGRRGCGGAPGGGGGCMRAWDAHGVASGMPASQAPPGEALAGRRGPPDFKGGGGFAGGPPEATPPAPPVCWVTPLGGTLGGGPLGGGGACCSPAGGRGRGGTLAGAGATERDARRMSARAAALILAQTSSGMYSGRVAPGELGVDGIREAALGRWGRCMGPGPPAATCGEAARGDTPDEAAGPDADAPAGVGGEPPGGADMLKARAAAAQGTRGQPTKGLTQNGCEDTTGRAAAAERDKAGDEARRAKLSCTQWTISSVYSSLTFVSEPWHLRCSALAYSHQDPSPCLHVRSSPSNMPSCEDARRQGLRMGAPRDLRTCETNPY